jgi:hypothetical protein
MLETPPDHPSLAPKPNHVFGPIAKPYSHMAHLAALGILIRATLNQDKEPAKAPQWFRQTLLDPFVCPGPFR